MTQPVQNISKKFNDAENEIRLAIMNFIIDFKRPFHVIKDGYQSLNKIHLSEKKDFSSIIAVLKEQDGMMVDAQQNVNFIYPVSALPTNHHVTLADGRSFCAMCAIDAIGSAFTFQQDIDVHSKCSMCGKEVYVKIKDGQIAEYSPQGLHALSFILGEISNWGGSC